ncbi:MAG: hypothetical protein JSS20_07020 [Proteobacteria bacterium]|nr:hypothetical protein [Pseudomonadota bacterium]
MIRFRAGLAVLLLAISTVAASAQGWQLPPLGYSYQVAAPCLDDPVRAVKPLRPGGAVYKLCDDQVAYLAASIEAARAEKKLLIVTVGAAWCPWCASLQRQMPGPEFFGRAGDAIDWAGTFRHIEIGLATTHKGRNAAIPSGQSAVEALLKRSGGVKIEAIPFVFIIDPEQPDRVFAANTKELSDEATGTENMARFRELVAGGYQYLRGVKKADAR